MEPGNKDRFIWGNMGIVCDNGIIILMSFEILNISYIISI